MSCVLRHDSCRLICLNTVSLSVAYMAAVESAVFCSLPESLNQPIHICCSAYAAHRLFLILSLVSNVHIYIALLLRLYFWC